MLGAPTYPHFVSPQHIHGFKQEYHHPKCRSPRQRVRDSRRTASHRAKLQKQVSKQQSVSRDGPSDVESFPSPTVNPPTFTVPAPKVQVLPTVKHVQTAATATPSFEISKEYHSAKNVNIEEHCDSDKCSSPTSQNSSSPTHTSSITLAQITALFEEERKLNTKQREKEREKERAADLEKLKERLSLKPK